MPRRWQVLKPTKSEKQAECGQRFMFPLHDDPLAPWEKDDTDAIDCGDEEPIKLNPPTVPPDDEIPF